MASDDVQPLDVVPVAAVAPAAEPCAWLIDSLWTAQGAGWIASSPKSAKTWLALDMAVSVASGTEVARHFPVRLPGRVLFYGAEDSLPHIRERVESIATARGLALDELDLGLIATPALRLDTQRDLARLRKTLDRSKPRLLILDPLVRLHRCAEDSAQEISALLADLRELQRTYGIALVLVHHLRKKAASGGPDGQSLRGSGDLHAWSDDSLYLRRRDNLIVVTVEHRSAPSPPPCTLELVTDPTPHLRVVDAGGGDPAAASQLAEQILKALADAGRPLTREALRDSLRTRNATLGEALVQLRATGRIERSSAGFTLRTSNETVPPFPP